MPINLSPTVDLAKPPSSQFASSLFHQAIGSLPVSIAVAIVSTKICYHWLPEAAAAALAMQIQAVCLVSGGVSGVKAAWDLTGRSAKLTDAKLSGQGYAPALMPDTVSAGGDVTVNAALTPQVAPQAKPQANVPLNDDLSGFNYDYNKPFGDPLADEKPESFDIGEMPA